VEQLDVDVDPVLRRELLDEIDWLVESTTRWYLSGAAGLPAGADIELARKAFEELEDGYHGPDFADWREQRAGQVAGLIAAGIPVAMAKRHVYQTELIHAPDIIELAGRGGRDVREVAKLFILIGDRYRLDWLQGQVERLSASSRWRRWAIRSLEADLVRLRRDLAGCVLADSDELGPEQALESYVRSRSERHARLTQFMHLLTQDGESDLDSLLVAERQIRALAVAGS
jgi:glutamate dehydrogenase